MSSRTAARSLAGALASVGRPDAAVALETRRTLDAKTKPLGSLGRLEDLACRLAAIRGAALDRPLRSAIVVAAADHGVARNGVSAYPAHVTRQMLATFATGGAAICVLARRTGARLVVVDAGVRVASDEATTWPPPGVLDARVANGTDDLSIGPAMSRDVAVDAIERGLAVAGSLADDGIDVLALGEMGIGNTTSAAAIAAALLALDPAHVGGPGTGLGAVGIERKVEVVRRALDVNGVGPGSDPIDVLAAVGGLEIAFLVGVVIGSAGRRVPVVLDGVITGVAALVASRLEPRTIGSMIAGTRSPEPAHAHVLGELGLEPLLDLGLRLGEGSGAALALPLIDAAVAIVLEMATFETAGVSERS